MILSVRFEAAGDTPGQVVWMLDYCEERLGLPPEARQDVIESYGFDGEGSSGWGYKGRRKLTYQTPLNAAQEREWRNGGAWPFDAQSGEMPDELGYDEELKMTPTDLAAEIGVPEAEIRRFLTLTMKWDEEYLTPFLIERVQEHFDQPRTGPPVGN